MTASHFNTHENVAAEVCAKSTAIGRLEIAEMKVTPAVENLPPLCEQYRHKAARDLEPVLTIEKHHVVIVETKWPKTTQCIRTAESGLEIERNAASGCGIRQSRIGAQRDHALFAEKW